MAGWSEGHLQEDAGQGSLRVKGNKWSDRIPYRDRVKQLLFLRVYIWPQLEKLLAVPVAITLIAN